MILKLLLLFASVAFAIHDPTITGIKTKTYHRNPAIASTSASSFPNSHHQREYQHFHTPNYQGTGERLSAPTVYNHNANTAIPIQRQQNLQLDDYYNQREIPLYERYYHERHAAVQPPFNWNTAANVMDEYYTGCPIGYTGQLPYAYDCRRFVNCWHGRAHIQSCGPGTVFNPETLECDRPDKVVCGSLSALAALKQPQVTSARYRAGRLLDTNSEHVDTHALCPPNASGLRPHPTDCTKFVNCANGNVHIQSCGPGTAYDISKMLCDFKDKVDCSTRGGAGGSASPYGGSSHYGGASGEFNRRDGKSYNQYGQHGSGYGDNTWSQQGQTQGHGYLTTDSNYNTPTSHSYGSTKTTSYGQQSGGDRWSNMNMQRPAGGASHSSASSSSWSGMGSFVENQRPSETVLYEEGSLQPDHNYIQSSKTYTVQLAPFSSNTFTETNRKTSTASTNSDGNIYYAQPVGSQENSGEVFNNPIGGGAYQPRHDSSSNRQSYNRELNYGTSSSTLSNHGIPLPNQNLMPPHGSDSENTASGHAYTQSSSTLSNHGIPVPNQNLMPPHGSDSENTASSYAYTQSSSTTSNHAVRVPNQNLMPPHGSSVENTESGHANTQIVNMPVTHLMPPVRTDSDTDERPVGGFYPTPTTQLMPPMSSSDSVSRAYGETYSSSSNSDSGQRPLDVTYTPSNWERSDHYPTRTRKTPIIDASNLYGGMLPPPPSSTTNQSTTLIGITTPSMTLLPPLHSTTTYTSQIQPAYPDINNATVNKHQDPHYSPSYASVAHHTSNVQGGIKTAQRNEGNVLTSTEHYGAMPPPYNRQYYPPSTAVPASSTHRRDESDINVGELPISDALRMLLRPYFNRSGSVSEESAAQAESHIMQLIPATSSVTTTNTTTTITTTSTSSRTKTSTAPVDPVKAHKDDAELIIAGEQHSLMGGSQNRNTQTIATNIDRDQERLTTVDGTNWHESGREHEHEHSRDFHLRHPHRHHNNHNHQHQHQHQHSREFHLRHPNLPNPFTTEKRINREQNPPVESTTPLVLTRVGGIDVRASFPMTPSNCPFDCGNGNCVKTFEVCDGVNNCGNRKDESQCDHLGYKVRLTGGDSPNKGRIEVKVNGKWGYVCDDKFGLRDADVVCKELGFELGASEVLGNSFYLPSEPNFTFSMDEVDCKGNETSLKDCDFKGWGVSNCGPDEVVGVVCKVPLLKCPNNYWLCSTSKECIPPAFVCDNTPDCSDKSDESEQVCNSPIEYRLEGGRNTNEGRLEVKYRGEWGTVCDDDFGLKEAQVVCNSLGYYGKPAIEKNIYGPGNGPIWLDQVSCFGNETSMDKCTHWSWGEHNCNHSEDVGLKCTAGPPPRRNGKNERNKFNSQPDNGQKELDLGQKELEDIGLYSGQWERSSKAIKNNERRCGHFKDDLIDEYDHPEERVVNGTKARRGRHPWQATIRTRGRGGISSHWCGAVLISKRHLLTAAHCLAGYPKGAYFVRMGDHYANIAESSEIDSYIENWYIHEKFRDITHMNNDIALVVLKTPVRFNDYVQPVCLPEKGAQLEEKRLCTISGWGSIKSGISTPSNILRAAQLPIQTDETCRQPHVYGDTITEGMFCAGYMDENVDACDGDSGGPLICSDPDGETLYGIISWGQHCGYANKPGVYVRVAQYVDWIYEKINKSLQHAGH